MNKQLSFLLLFVQVQSLDFNFQHQRLSVMSMELHVSTRQKLRPDPEFDAIEAIFAVVSNDVPDGGSVPQTIESEFSVPHISCTHDKKTLP